MGHGGVGADFTESDSHAVGAELHLSDWCDDIAGGSNAGCKAERFWRGIDFYGFCYAGRAVADCIAIERRDGDLGECAGEPNLFNCWNLFSNDPARREWFEWTGDGERSVHCEEPASHYECLTGFADV